MDMQELRYFVTVAELGNYSAAASTLFVSRQAVTKGIRKIETEIGRPLFEPDGKRLVLTPEGASLLDDARPLVDGFAELCRTHLSSTPLIGNRYQESLHICVTQGWNMDLAADPIVAYHNMYPSVVPYVLEGEPAAVARSVSSKHADIGILGTHPSLVSGFDHTPLAYSSIFIVMPSDHQLASKSHIELHDLDQQGFVVAGASDHLRTFVFSECQRNGYRPIITFETNNWSTMEEVALSSKVLRFGRDPNKVPLTPGMKALPLRFPGFEAFGVYAIRRHSKNHSSTARSFWESLQEYSAQQSKVSG